LQLVVRRKLYQQPSAAVISSALLGIPELQGVQKILAGIAPLIAKILPTLPVDHGIASDNLSHDEEYLAKRHEDPLINHVSTPQWVVAVKKAMAILHERAKEFQHLCPTLFLLAGDEKITNLNDARRFAFHAYGGMKHKVIEFPGYYHELEKEPGIRARLVSETIAWLNSHSSR
jgi:alpha-beta hydrolase superfamily lysophospholipase